LASTTDIGGCEAAVEAALNRKYLEGPYASALNVYRSLTTSMKGNIFPITYGALLAVAGLYVSGPSGHKSSSLKGFISRLKMGATALRYWSLTSEEYVRILWKADQLCVTYPSTVKFSVEVREGLLHKMRRHLESQHTPESLETWTISVVLHQTLARGGEILNGALLGTHVTISPTSLSLFLPLHKTGKRSIDLRTDQGIALSRKDGLDAVEALKKFISVRGKATGKMYGADQPIFTSLDGKPITYRRYLDNLRSCLRELGIPDWKSYGVHSFRSGGLSDMRTEKNREECAKRGRWKSDTMDKLYWRPTPKDFHQTGGK
jgi:hypothetical protein